MADELHELKGRLADLSSAVDELLARQRAEQPTDPPPPLSATPDPPPPPPATPET